MCFLLLGLSLNSNCSPCSFIRLTCAISFITLCFLLLFFLVDHELFIWDNCEPQLCSFRFLHYRRYLYLFSFILQPEFGSQEKPEEIFHIIEHFCLGRRRLHVFGNDSTLRPGKNFLTTIFGFLLFDRWCYILSRDALTGFMGLRSIN